MTATVFDTPTQRYASADLGDARHLQDLSRHQGSQQRATESLGRRDPVPDGRERRRQEHPDEGALRRLPCRCRRADPDRRQGRGHHQPACRPRARHLDHLSGTEPAAQPERRREHLFRPRAVEGRDDRPPHHEGKLPGRAPAPRRHLRSGNRSSRRFPSPSASLWKSPARSMPSPRSW